MHSAGSGPFFFLAYLSHEKNRNGGGGRAESLACADANAIPLMRVSCFYKKARISPAGLTWNGVGDKARCHALLLPTAVRAEHRPRPHSDERPSLPRWDVSSSQTPASHHAPVTVATYSCAHRPRGPRQGGPPSHINIFCLRSGVGGGGTCRSEFGLFPVCVCVHLDCEPLARCRKSLTV